MYALAHVLVFFYTSVNILLCSFSRDWSLCRNATEVFQRYVCICAYAYYCTYAHMHTTVHMCMSEKLP